MSSKMGVSINGQFGSTNSTPRSDNSGDHDHSKRVLGTRTHLDRTVYLSIVDLLDWITN